MEHAQSLQQVVLELAARFCTEDEERCHPQTCWQRLRTDLTSIVENAEVETWASFENLVVDFPGRVASVYGAPFPPQYFPTVCGVVLNAQWLGSLAPEALTRVQSIVQRLLTLGKEAAVAAALASQDASPQLQAFILQLAPIDRLVLALVKSHTDCFLKLVPKANASILRSLTTFVPLRVRVTTLETAENLQKLISLYGSAVSYIAREWSHPLFTKRQDESANRSTVHTGLTLLLYAVRRELNGELLPIVAEGVQARLASPVVEFRNSGLVITTQLVAAQLYDSLQSSLDQSDRIDFSLAEYLGKATEVEGDSDDESDYESEGETTQYLSEITDALDCQNKLRVSRAIFSAASVISQDLDELDVEAPRLAETLLKVENTFDLPRFEDARFEALVSLTVLRPALLLPELRKRVREAGGQVLVLRVLEASAEAMGRVDPVRTQPQRRESSAKTRYFRTSKAPTGTSTRFSQYHAPFLQVALDLFLGTLSAEVFASGALTLCKLIALSAHLRSQELTRTLVYSLRNCVRPGLRRPERECITASLQLLDTVLRQLVSAEDWQSVLASVLLDYSALRDDLSAVLLSLEQLQLPGLEQTVAEIAAKVHILRSSY